MMISWEWSPAWGDSSKPCHFEQAGQTWTHVRSGRSGKRWLPLVILAWVILVTLVEREASERILVWIGGTAVLAGWFISRHVLERGWRLSSDRHLWVLTQTGKAKDLGAVASVRWLEEADFQSFRSKSFSSLHFPMLEFKDAEGRVAVLGSIPCLVSKGFQLPFSGGFFYASKTWGRFTLKPGQERAALLVMETGARWILFSCTKESLLRQLNLPPLGE